MSHAIVNRREFLKTGAAAGATLVIGLYLPAVDPRGSHAPSAREPFKPNAWIEIRPDGAVTIWTGRSEMGQGVRTAMPMIVAEELEARAAGPIRAPGPPRPAPWAPPPLPPCYACLPLSSTSRVLRANASGVNGFWRNATPASSKRFWSTASPV